MTSLLGLPFLSTVSATIAAITAPTNPTPITTTTSLPALRAEPASFSSRANSAAYSSLAGNENFSPAGLTETSLPLAINCPFELEGKQTERHKRDANETAGEARQPAPLIVGHREANRIPEVMRRRRHPDRDD